MLKLPKTILITGAGRRIGAAIAQLFHQQSFNVIIHYRHSQHDAEALVSRLNFARQDSAICLGLDLERFSEYSDFVAKCTSAWGGIDILINNASTFFSTEIASATENAWENLMNSNLKAPFFLSQAFAPFLKKTGGAIINISDIHAVRPLKGYSIYSIAKAGLNMLTKSLARELAPEIRVNAVAPGNVLWPEQENALSLEQQEHLIDKTLLKRAGQPFDVAEAAYFLATQKFITGHTLAVDGGKLVK